MNITQKDKELFDYLRKSEHKKDLLDYLERLNQYLCDVRNWKKYDDVVARAMIEASNVLEENLINKVKYDNPTKKITSFE